MQIPIKKDVQQEVLNKLYSEYREGFSVDELRVSNNLKMLYQGILITDMGRIIPELRGRIKYLYSNQETFSSVNFSSQEVAMITTIANSNYEQHSESLKTLYKYDIALTKCGVKVTMGENYEYASMRLQQNTKYKMIAGRQMVIPFVVTPAFSAHVSSPESILVPVRTGKSISYAKEKPAIDSRILRVHFAESIAYTVEVKRSMKMLLGKRECSSVQELGEALCGSEYRMLVARKMKEEVLVKRIHHLSISLEEIAKFRGERINVESFLRTAETSIKLSTTTYE